MFLMKNAIVLLLLDQWGHALSFLTFLDECASFVSSHLRVFIMTLAEEKALI